MAEIVDLESPSGGELEENFDTGASDIDLQRRVKPNLNTLLDDIKYPGTFACSGALETRLWDPRISVRGVGSIELPLTPDAARAIAQTCHQAPFGRGEETIVDASFRNTWELNPDDFTITEPRWHQQFLPHIVREAATKLGAYTNCRAVVAQLYKMLLFEKGAMFKPHRDTEKIPGMFGTLVICLPSSHEGGNLHARHARQTKVLKSSDHKASFIAWYSDVEHEVKEVTSGYRWVLTYNLIAEGQSGSVSAAAGRVERMHAQHNLRVWKKQCDLDRPSWNTMVHLFLHRYTDASLQLSSLKGEDRAVADLLIEGREAVGLKPFLASIEQMRYGAAEASEHEDDYGYASPEDERSHWIRRLLTASRHWSSCPTSMSPAFF